MSIAAANLFSRNVWRDYVRPNPTPREEARASKLMSLLVKVGALLFILLAPATQVINFQLAGGVWIIQTLPAVFLALYVPWVHRWAAVAGWVAGMTWGTVMLAQEHFDASTHALFGTQLYIAFTAVVANVLVVVLGSLALNALGVASPTRLAEADYLPQPGPKPERDPLALEPDASEPLLAGRRRARPSARRQARRHGSRASRPGTRPAALRVRGLR
jgi:solute:Na+ symporter, SSS family